MSHTLAELIPIPLASLHTIGKGGHELEYTLTDKRWTILYLGSK